MTDKIKHILQATAYSLAEMYNVYDMWDYEDNPEILNEQSEALDKIYSLYWDVPELKDVKTNIEAAVGDYGIISQEFGFICGFVMAAKMYGKKGERLTNG